MNFMLRSAFRRLPVLVEYQCKKLLAPIPVRTITIKVISPHSSQCDAVPENHDDRNMRLGRPMSPHLSIYKTQLTSMLSLAHRTTGIWLMVYTWILAFGSHVIDLPQFIEFLHGVNFPAILIIVLKFILSFPLSYHLSNGLRHFFWDMGAMLDLKKVYSSGYAMLAASCAGSAFCATL
ncbi:uncharacterized protein LOC108738376 [Agrilus planipennis]|uniref:Uncharacterized protein LOC108738376 n=1 Tax=Agrilus planipennis TaxID=224129 RepID=A0A1W4X4H1_AGRPL|nr:uncharacterized protein LOC108738376 [Agrilus planipennis]